MSENPGQDDVSVGMSATLNEASVKDTIEKFKAMLKEGIQGSNGIQIPVTFEQLKTDFTPEKMGVDPEVWKAAIDQIAASMNKVVPVAEGAKQALDDVGAATTRVKRNTEDALSNMGPLYDAYRAKVDGIKEAMSEFAAQSGASFTDIQKTLAPNVATTDVRALGQATKELNKDQKDAEKAAKDLQNQQDQLGKSSLSLGDIFRVVFGVTLMQLGVQAFRAIINVMKEAIQAGIDYAQTLFRLSVAVRDMQRSGAAVTIKDFTDMAAALQKQFPTFSLQSLVSGISDAVLLTKELGFTKDQMGEVAKASITLASIWGKDVNEVMRTMALTLSSGYSEGLQRLGININKVVITEKAHTMGIKEGYNAMTQQQRAMAAFAVILEQVNGMQEDAAKYQETAPGKLDKLAAAWKDFKAAIGTALLGDLASIADALISIVKGIADLDASTTDLLSIYEKGRFERISFVLSEVARGLAIIMVTLSTINRILHGELLITTKDFFDELNRVIDAGVKNAQDQAHKIVYPDMSLPDITGKTSSFLDAYGFSEEDQQKVLDATDSLNTSLADLAKQGADKLAQIELDKSRDLQKIDETMHRDLLQAEQDYQRNLAQLALDNQRKIADINLKTARASSDAQTSLSRDLVNIEQDYENSVADAKLKYQQSQADKEAAYQLKIKQMQEQYLYDIDEAVRSGNAKQALQITRRLKLEYNLSQETHASDIGQMQTDFDRQMTELERQKQQKIQQRQQEFQQKLADLAVQAAQERADQATQYQQQRADAAAQYAQKQADTQAKAEQDRADRETQYRQQLSDLQDSQNDQFKTIADGLLKQYNLTNLMLEAVYKSYLTIYGPSGALDKLYAYAIASAQNTGIDILKGLSIGATGSASIGTVIKPLDIHGAAEGGTFIASRPMTLKIAERGPEVATIMPLSYLGKNTGKIFGNLPGGGNNGRGNGNLDIKILLSSDLEARIVNSSVDAMSDILVRVEREGR